MEVGRRVTPVVAKEMVSTFLRAKHVEIDTATMYADTETEKILGNISEWKNRAIMATKINPWGDGSMKMHGLNFTAESVRQQTEDALARLGVDCVDILYLHAPDHKTSLFETMSELAKLKEEGKFKELGLSNYSSWLTCEVVNIAKQNGFPVPTVYQGMYSALTRQVEAELLPCLRYHGIRFYGYSPLAGGLLTGKHSLNDIEGGTVKSGRFNGLSMDNVYRDRYFKTEYFKGLEEISKVIREAYPEKAPTLPEAAYSWILHHSKLNGDLGDGMVLGASSIRQLNSNLEMCQVAPLKPEVVETFENVWLATSHLCPSYLR